MSGLKLYIRIDVSSFNWRGSCMVYDMAEGELYGLRYVRQGSCMIYGMAQKKLYGSKGAI